MNKFGKVRRLVISIVGVIPLILSLVNVKPVFADAPRADISVSITANRRTVRLGQNVTFTVRVTNHGPAPAPFIDIYHNLPDQLRLVDMTCDHGISADTPACEYSIIEPGETVVSTVVATPNPDALPHKRHLVTTVTFMYEGPAPFDPHSRNNTDSVAVQWVGRLR